MFLVWVISELLLDLDLIVYSQFTDETYPLVSLCVIVYFGRNPL